MSDVGTYTWHKVLPDTFHYSVKRDGVVVATLRVDESIPFPSVIADQMCSVLARHEADMRRVDV